MVSVRALVLARLLVLVRLLVLARFLVLARVLALGPLLASRLDRLWELLYFQDFPRFPHRGRRFFCNLRPHIVFAGQLRYITDPVYKSIIYGNMMQIYM